MSDEPEHDIGQIERPRVLECDVHSEFVGIEFLDFDLSDLPYRARFFDERPPLTELRSSTSTTSAYSTESAGYLGPALTAVLAHSQASRSPGLAAGLSLQPRQRRDALRCARRVS